MVKLINLVLLLLLSHTTQQLYGQDYEITINGKNKSINLDEEYTLSVNGENITFLVHAKDTLVYEEDLFDFKYLKNFRVSKLELEEEIDQFMIFTAEGSGFLLQQYKTINPKGLENIMLTEITKESINYGYEEERSNYTRTLSSGQTVDIVKSTLTYNNETNIYEVASISGKDKGIIIATIVMDINISKQGSEIIKMMWETLNFMD